MNVGGRHIKAGDAVSGIVCGKITITQGDPSKDLSLQGHLSRNAEFTFIAKLHERTKATSHAEPRVERLQVWHKDKPIMLFGQGVQEMPASWKEKVVVKDILGALHALDRDLLGQRKGKGPKF